MENSNTEYKRELFKLYNAVNKEIYGYGVTELKVSCMEDMIIFRTRHNRVRALQILEEHYALLKQSVDQALFSEFKRMFRKELEEKMGLHIAGMLRDYDTNIRTAVTVVILATEENNSVSS